MVPSMSRPANPYDNAFCESFMKTLKQEEIYCHQYRDFQELSAHLEEFIGNYYNRQRLHSAVGYRTPEEFEQSLGAAASGLSGATVRLFQPETRYEGISAGNPALAREGTPAAQNPATDGGQPKMG